MRWQAVTYNGSTIHGTAYAALSGAGAMDLLNMPSSDAQFVSRGLDTPGAYAGADYRPREFSIVFKRNGTGGAQPTQTQYGDMIETLKGIFYPPAAGTLVVQDLDDSNKAYQIVAVAVNSPVLAFPMMEIQFAAADPRYYAAAGTTTANLTSSPGTITVTNNGNQALSPVIRITPTGAKTGDYAYKLPVVTYNPGGTAVTGYPVDLATDTSTGVWSTTAMVSGGSALASGNDMRLRVGGVERDRWLSGMNSGTTKLWALVDYAPYTPLIVKTAVSSSGTPSAIVFKETAANNASMKRIPDTGELYHPATGERLTYSAKKGYTVVPQYRGVKGGAAGTIPAGGTLVWLDNPDVWFYYGNAAAEAPVTDDDVMPMFNLSTSTNTSWDYDEFWVSPSTRAGDWQSGVLNATSLYVLRRTGTYGGDHQGEANLVTDMGMRIASWQKGGVWKAEDAVVEWRWSNPMGATAVTSTGEKYRTGASWPDKMALQASRNGSSWTTIWDEASPGTASAYANLSANGSAYSLGGTFPYLRYAADGVVTAGSAAVACLEISDVTISLATAPVVRRGAQQASYPVNCTIENVTTGDKLTFSGLIALNDTIEIDCGALTVRRLSDGTDLSGGLATSTARLEWLNLATGANVITYTDSGMGNLTLQFITRDVLV